MQMSVYYITQVNITDLKPCGWFLPVDRHLRETSLFMLCGFASFGTIVKWLLLGCSSIVVLRVPSGRPTNRWHGLGRWGLGGIGKLLIFLVYI